MSFLLKGDTSFDCEAETTSKNSRDQDTYTSKVSLAEGTKTRKSICSIDFARRQIVKKFLFWKLGFRLKGCLVNSSRTMLRIFKANETVTCRGIEIEQFPDWKWLFADTTHRTSAQ